MTRRLKCVAAILAIQLGQASSKKRSLDLSKYWVEGESDRALDTACGFPTPSLNCSVSPNQLKLRPGAVIVIDDFLNDAEYGLLRGIVRKAIVKADPRYLIEQEEALGTTFTSVIGLPGKAKQRSMLALIRRIHGYAVRTIHSLSNFKDGPWAYKGDYFPDFWSIRRYHHNWNSGSNKLDFHQDTGSYARCLSAVLFFGANVEGGNFRTHRCKRGDCNAYGYQYDFDLPDKMDILNEGNLETLADVPYKSGRLVYFLAETVHDVTMTVRGNRDILFIWFGCEASLLNGIVDNGHLELVQFLVEQKADVASVTPAHGQRAFHTAVQLGHASLATYLLTLDPKAVHKRQGKGSMPLHLAAAAGHKRMVEFLVTHNADVTAKDDTGASAKEYAWRHAQEVQDATVFKLLQHLEKGGKLSSEL